MFHAGTWSLIEATFQARPLLNRLSAGVCQLDFGKRPALVVNRCETFTESERPDEERGAAVREWSPTNGSTSVKPPSTGQNPLGRRVTDC
jgi:hypothetical protein